MKKVWDRCLFIITNTYSFNGCYDVIDSFIIRSKQMRFIKNWQCLFESYQKVTMPLWELSRSDNASLGVIILDGLLYCDSSSSSSSKSELAAYTFSTSSMPSFHNFFRQPILLTSTSNKNFNIDANANRKVGRCLK